MAKSKKQGIGQMIPLGKSVLLMDIRDAVRYFPGSGYIQLLYIMRALNVPLIYMKNCTMFNVYTLEKAMSYISRVGAKSFAFPGSREKAKGKLLDKWFAAHPGETRAVYQLTDEDMAKIAKRSDIKPIKEPKKAECNLSSQTIVIPKPKITDEITKVPPPPEE